MSNATQLHVHSQRPTHDYIHSYNKAIYDTFLNQIPKEEIALHIPSKKDQKEYIRLLVISADLLNKVDTLLHAYDCNISKSIQVKSHFVMNYCEARKWSEGSALPYIGFHSTSIKNSESILQTGFYPHSLFTCQNIYQTLQVGERHGKKYIILMCLFKIGKVLSNTMKDGKYAGKYVPVPWDYEQYKKNLENAKIEATYEGYTADIVNPRDVTIFGYITCDQEKYSITLF